MDREGYLMEHWADFFSQPRKRTGRSRMFGTEEVEEDE